MLVIPKDKRPLCNSNGILWNQRKMLVLFHQMILSATIMIIQSMCKMQNYHHLRHWTIHQLLLTQADNDILNPEVKWVRFHILHFRSRVVSITECQRMTETDGNRHILSQDDSYRLRQTNTDTSNLTHIHRVAWTDTVRHTT